MPVGVPYWAPPGVHMLELRLLGQFEVRLDETPMAIPSRPAQSLLAFLALTAGTAHRRERLAGLLWPDAQEDSARASLRQGLWRLRKALEAHLPPGVQYLLADDLTVAFNPGAGVPGRGRAGSACGRDRVHRTAEGGSGHVPG